MYQWTFHEDKMPNLSSQGSLDKHIIDQTLERNKKHRYTTSNTHSHTRFYTVYFFNLIVVGIPMTVFSLASEPRHSPA